MYRYYATFVSGAQEIAADILRERDGDLRILALLDGGVEFETALPYSDLNLFCFHNIFLVIHRAELSADAAFPNGSIRELLRREPDWTAAGGNSSKVRTFRLVISRQNRLVSADPSLRAGLEKRLGQVSGLRPDRSRPDTEFWLLSRSEGFCYLLKRLSRHTSYDKLLDPGELHPELACMMCWLSRPKHTDTVLDPFCGCGSIPIQRTRRFPFSAVLGFDNNEKVLARAREKAGKRREGLRWEAHDALALDRVLPPDSVDAVITDPPWGLYQELDMDLTDFYRRTLEQLLRVLKAEGRLVLLTAGKDELLQAAEESGGFALLQRHDILVSGKKAGLFVFSVKK